jgi:hypothetical protein
MLQEVIASYLHVACDKLIIIIAYINKVRPYFITPFKICRRRFVIKIAFDVAISKVQVQTHKSVALHQLLTALFLMAWCYFEFSCSPSFNKVVVTILEDQQNPQKIVDKSNIVYREVP